MHYLYDVLPNRTISCIEMKSFYASWSAASKGFDVMNESIAIVNNLNQKSSIVLAKFPFMKNKFGIKTGHRIFEIK